MADKMQFRRATRSAIHLRMALYGPSGSGKTYTSLAIGTAIAEAAGGRVALIDTENRSSERFAEDFRFDVLSLDEYHPNTYIEAMQLAVRERYAVLIIDSLTHAWDGPGGLKEQLDVAKKRYKGNSWAAWADLTPHQNRLVYALTHAPIHLLVTMRSKTAWDTTKDEKGQAKPVKIGLEPIQRQGLEYEFDILGQLDHEHNLMVEKARGLAALDNKLISLPGRGLGEALARWLSGETRGEDAGRSEPGSQSAQSAPRNTPPRSKPAPPEPDSAPADDGRSEVTREEVDALFDALQHDPLDDAGQALWQEACLAYDDQDYETAADRLRYIAGAETATTTPEAKTAPEPKAEPRARRVDERRVEYDMGERKPTAHAAPSDVGALRTRASQAFVAAFNSAKTREAKAKVKAAVEARLGSDSISAIRDCDDVTRLEQLAGELEAVAAEVAA